MLFYFTKHMHIFEFDGCKICLSRLVIAVSTEMMQYLLNIEH